MAAMFERRTTPNWLHPPAFFNKEKEAYRIGLSCRIIASPWLTWEEATVQVAIESHPNKQVCSSSSPLLLSLVGLALIVLVLAAFLLLIFRSFIYL